MRHRIALPTTPAVGILQIMAKKDRRSIFTAFIAGVARSVEIDARALHAPRSGDAGSVWRTLRRDGERVGNDIRRVVARDLRRTS